MARVANLLVGLLLTLPFIFVAAGGFMALAGKLMALGALVDVGIVAVILGGAAIALVFFTDVGQLLMFWPWPGAGKS